MQKTPLFRDQALEAQKENAFSGVILHRSRLLDAIASVSVVLVLLVIAFISLAEYPQKVIAIGQLTSETGLTFIFPQESGLVKRVYKRNGDTVKIGEPLFDIAGAKHTDGANIVDTVLQDSSKKLVQLRQEGVSSERLIELENVRTKETIKQLYIERHHINELIWKATESRQMHEANVEKYASHYKNGYISEEAVLQKQHQLIEARSKVDELQRALTINMRNIKEQEAKILENEERKRNEEIKLSRQMLTIEQEVSTNKHKLNQQILAPHDGVLVELGVGEGHQTDANKKIAAIAPQNTLLVAELFIPADAIGFVKIGDQLTLRFRAYPYQKYGYKTGEIKHVAAAAILASDISNLGETLPYFNQPVYRVLATVSGELKFSGGNTGNFQVGMIVDADIVTDQRRLYRWMLDPIISTLRK